MLRRSGVASEGVKEPLMTMHDEHDYRHSGESLEVSREHVLATAPRFPGHDAMVIDGLTDDEEAAFLAALGLE